MITFASRIYLEHNNEIIHMKQESARVSMEMPENEEKKTLHQELTYEIENNDIQDEYTVKF